MFKYFDASDTDEITFEDLVTIRKRNGNVEVDEGELKKMILEADQKSQGKINFEDFKKLIKNILIIILLINIYYIFLYVIKKFLLFWFFKY